MYLRDLLKRSKADAEASGGQYDADAQTSKDFDPSMSVRMIRIGRLRGQYHTHEHENGREDIAQELETCSQNGSRSSRISDPYVPRYVPRGEHTAREYACPSDSLPEAQILVILRHSPVFSLLVNSKFQYGRIPRVPATLGDDCDVNRDLLQPVSRRVPCAVGARR
jgi:hypothetical protein